MPDVTRRGFLAGVSVATGVGVAGGLGLHTLLPADASASTSTSTSSPTSASPSPQAAMQNSVVQPASIVAQAPATDTVTLAGPMLIHIRDLATAEIAMMVGTQELVYRDPELVSRLVRTAASAGRVEG